MISLGVGPNTPLDFSGSRSADYPGVARERKICEGFCGGMPFYRATPKTAKEGRKLCNGCIAKQAAWLKRGSPSNSGPVRSQ